MLIGLIDTGIAPELAATGSALITADPDRPADPHGHGTMVSRIIAAAAPQARILCVPAFNERGSASARAVAHALAELIAQRVPAILMPLGLPHDRDELRQACQDAADARILLIASAPARGLPCYPAAYPDVLSVSGDIRCAPDQTVWYGGRPALFGACPLPPPGSPPRCGGASMAAAHFAGHLLARFPCPDQRSIAALRHASTYVGRERKNL